MRTIIDQCWPSSSRELYLSGSESCKWVVSQKWDDCKWDETSGCSLGKGHFFSFSLKDSFDIFGVNIDDRLRFDNYISTICNKINGQCIVMLRFRKLISKDALLTIYKAFIMPHFNCCPRIWHFCGARSTEKIETLNKRILRFILRDL